MEPLLGIDFGTTNSAMAWYNPDTKRAEVLLNAEGEPKTPSVAYFGESETVVGKPALNLLQDPQESRHVVMSCKRHLQSNAVLALPRRRVTMVDAAAEILKKLKRDAEEFHFHAAVRRAVITCPAAFGGAERERIEQAAAKAGFAETRLLEEPVAAAIAYARGGLQIGQHILVYDLGGGTFDLAVLLRQGEAGFRLALEPRGLRQCGGDDFDRTLYDYLEKQIQATLSGSIESGLVNLNVLLRCRECKESLSQMSQSLFSVFIGHQRFQQRLNRSVLEGLIKEPIDETVRLTQALVAETAQRGHVVDTVVLIGGSVRIPLVEARLAETLPVKPHKWQQQDVAVALGAAYHIQEVWGENLEFKPDPRCLTSETELKYQLNAILGITASINASETVVNSHINSTEVSAEHALNQQLNAIIGAPSLTNAKLEDRILSVLRDFLPQDDFFVSPAIPPKKLTNARATCNVPSNEKILALIDCTVFGSAKDAFLFGIKGIYYRHLGCTPTVSSLSYSNFPNCKFKIVDDLGITLTPQLEFSLSGSDVSNRRVVDMLNAIRKLFI